jgi:hypothetical protein
LAENPSELLAVGGYIEIQVGPGIHNPYA